MNIESGTSARTAASGGTVVVLIATLLGFYLVSQFLRNSVGVIAPDLARDVGLSAAEIGILSSAFFFSFTAVQVPLGMALDRYGPRLCLLVCAGITVLGTVLFAQATEPWGLVLGRALLGIGCSSAFVAALAIYARRFPPQRFATLTGLQLGIGTFGTLMATAPLAYAAASIGWRASFLLVGAFTFVVAIAILMVVRDDAPQQKHAKPETLRESLSGLVEVLRTPSVTRLFIMNLVAYSSFAMVVGLWGGPYLTHVYGFGLEERGTMLLVPVLAQVVGSLAWGPTDRLLGSYKWPVLLGGALTAAALGVVATLGKLSIPLLIVWFVLFGFLCAYAPVLIAHGRALFPPHQVGRGLTVLNIGSMGGTFLVQLVSGFVIALFPVGPDGAYPLIAYQVVFGLQAGFIVLGLLAYFGSRDPLREPASAGHSQ